VKGVVLAGGTGSRLFPLTKVTNKHLLPVGRYPMIFHPIAKLAEAGITDILVVTGTEHMGDLVRVLGSGRELGLEFTYRVQDAPGGIAQALSLAEGFVGGDLCAVILGDNIFSAPIAAYADAFARQGEGCLLLLKEVPDPERYGVAEFDPEGGRIVAITEKPLRPPSPFAVTGIYFYDPEVFSIARGLTPSARGELEITDVNNAYLRQGKLSHRILDGWWTDAGTFSSWSLANHLAKAVTLSVFSGRRRYATAEPSDLEAPTSA
jgi:glucose-1-phosphate thymidylyltransferase